MGGVGTFLSMLSNELLWSTFVVRMNNLTRIMPIPFWDQGPLVTPFGISFGGGVGEFSLTQTRLDRL